ncbi:MAG: hypothetical protein MUF69_05635, partial [Desulfobacterota bacterium]|nr:hypothetical protein [Thermodesulfobacteriota bacterium]
TARTVKMEKKGPGKLEVKGADLQGHQITRADTGEKVGALGHTQSVMELPAGIYNVTVGKAVWKSVEVKAGEKTTLRPGRVQVVKADYRGHKIRNKKGEELGSVSNTQDWMPLPPGEYTIEVKGKVVPFTLKEGEELKFQ